MVHPVIINTENMKPKHNIKRGNVVMTDVNVHPILNGQLIAG